MKTYTTVTQAKKALDEFLRSTGDSHDGAHYVRPDKSRGPIVRYSCQNFSMEFAVDRAHGGGWRIANAWLWYDGEAVFGHVLFGFRIWEDSPI
jgi:hypothetical protein